MVLIERLFINISIEMEGVIMKGKDIKREVENEVVGELFLRNEWSYIILIVSNRLDDGKWISQEKPVEKYKNRKNEAVWSRSE